MKVKLYYFSFFVFFLNVEAQIGISNNAPNNNPNIY